MGEDEKMLRIGFSVFSAVVILTIALQVCYRTQNRMRDHVHRDTIRTQQEIAQAEANFASYVRPEILRNMVVTIDPHSESIRFNKTVSIAELVDAE